MRVYFLGSGSTGNLTVVEAEGARIVLDAGVNPTQAVLRMRQLGADLFDHSFGTALGIVVSHEHGDHFAQAQPLSRALRAPLYLHGGTVAPALRRRCEVIGYEPGSAFTIGPFTIEAMVVPHDAVQVALRVSAGGRAFAMATDLGHVPPGFARFVGEADLAMVEANYCPRMLAEGPYPPSLKRRVGGAHGHLANEQTARLASELSRSRLARLLLGHLSRVNNSPDRAAGVVRERAGRLPVEALPHGVARVFDVVAGRPVSGYAPIQLALPFGA